MASGYPRGRDQRGREHAAVQSCRDCALPMRWATNQNGKRIPLDVEPDLERGDNVLIVVEGWALCVQLRDSDLLEEARQIVAAAASEPPTDVALDRLFTCHWDTCPNNPRRERADLA